MQCRGTNDLPLRDFTLRSELGLEGATRYGPGDVRRIAALAKLARRILILAIAQRLRVVLRIDDDWGPLLRWLLQLEDMRWLHTDLHRHFKVPHVRGVRARVLDDGYRRELRLPG